MMQFQQIEEIGRGGMGIVYKAFSPDLNRYVIIKKLHPLLMADPLYQAGLKKEAAILSSLNHPHIVSLIEFRLIHFEQKREYCIVMDYIEGMNLNEWLKVNGPLPFEKLVPIFSDICSALSYLHQKNVFHLDLKPENILIASDGKAFLTDFGLASIHSSAGNTSPLLNPMGSLEYMPPEQIKGGSVDGRSDLYSIGMVLYTLLHGKNFFEGVEKSAIWGELVYNSNPLALTFFHEVPDYFQAIICKLVSKSPSDRYPDVQTLLHEFSRHYSRQAPNSESSPPSSLPLERGEDKGGRVWAEKQVILIVGLIFVFILFYTWGRLDQPAPNSSSYSLNVMKVTSPPNLQLVERKKTSEPIDPVIQLVSIQKEETKKNQLDDLAVLMTLDDQELESFLINFKSNVEHRDLEALEKEIQISPLMRSRIKRFFQDYPELKVESMQIIREGSSIRIDFQMNPLYDAVGNRIELAPQARQAVLRYRDGTWHLL